MKLRKLTPWLLGLLLASLLFAGLQIYAGFTYIGTDDAPILRSFMGFDGGEPASYSLILNSALSWLLYGLAKLFPGIAWFSILQLFMLWLSCVVIIKSAAQVSRRNGFPVWLGALTGFVFVTIYGAYIVCRINHAATAALIGAASVAQLLSVDTGEQSTASQVRSLIASVLLLAVAYCLRQMAGVATVAWWSFGWLVSLLCFAGKRRKGLLIGAVIMVLCVGGLYSFQSYENNRLGLADMLKWQDASTRLFDYTSFDENTDEETLEKVGWSPAELKLVANWYFMDQNITTEAFDTLYQAQMAKTDQSLKGRLEHGFQVFRSFLSVEPAMAKMIWLTLALCGLSVFGLLAKKRGKSLLTAAVVCTGLALMAMLYYLAFKGRMPMRAAASAVLPGGVTALLLLPACFARGEGKRVWPWIPAALCAVACVVLMAQSLPVTAQLLEKTRPAKGDAVSNEADLDAYALEHPDELIIYDLSLVCDARLFPDVSGGIPDNVMFWGGHSARSPAYMAQLAKFGIDGEHFTAEDWLRDNVIVASTDGEPWVSLLNYVQENVEGTVDYDFYDTYGYLNFFQLYSW